MCVVLELITKNHVLANTVLSSLDLQLSYRQFIGNKFLLR
jgi:hypothetical protein